LLIFLLLLSQKLQLSLLKPEGLVYFALIGALEVERKPERNIGFEASLEGAYFALDGEMCTLRR
jgi:hypothetical protein